jgi:two-component system NtrC family sensor kinase
VGDEISVGIADTGKGMTPDQMEKAFLPFYTTKDVGKGTGLGLSVSLGIVRSLGGSIRVESAPGMGSVFTVVLPIAGGGDGSAPVASRERVEEVRDGSKNRT